MALLRRYYGAIKAPVARRSKVSSKSPADLTGQADDVAEV
jgi:hypothetical protein